MGALKNSFFCRGCFRDKPIGELGEARGKYNALKFCRRCVEERNAKFARPPVREADRRRFRWLAENKPWPK